MKPPIETLKEFAEAMGGKVIAASGKSVGFSVDRRLFKLVLEGDRVTLHPLNAPNTAPVAVGTLQDLLSPKRVQHRI